MAATGAMTTRRPAPGWVFGGSLGAFFATFAALAFGAADDAPVAAKPRPVVVRRVITTVVVHNARPVRRVPETQPVAPPAQPPVAPAPLTTRSS
jgi:hypothetical protein